MLFAGSAIVWMHLVIWRECTDVGMIEIGRECTVVDVIDICRECAGVDVLDNS